MSGTFENRASSCSSAYSCDVRILLAWDYIMLFSIGVMIGQANKVCRILILVDFLMSGQS